MASPRLAARLAGLSYLVTIVTGVFAEVIVRGRVIVSGDAAVTARNILASEGSYRLAFVADLIGGVAYLVVTVVLYELLRPVSRSLALLAAFFSVIGIAIGGAGALMHLAPLFLLNGASYLRAFDTQQLQALAYVAIRLHAHAYLVALIFFGFYEALLGYLIFRSTFFPRALGVIVAVAGLAFLTNSFALFLAPAFGNAINSAMLLLDAIGEVGLMLWLLIAGVDAGRWKEASAQCDFP